jgi:hypothetical protein
MQQTGIVDAFVIAEQLEGELPPAGMTIGSSSVVDSAAKGDGEQSGSHAEARP